MINNDAEKFSSTNSSIILAPATGIDFMSGWKGIRSAAKLNDIDKREMRTMLDSDKANLNLFTDYEMVAEDIRIAITGKNLPASSKMTGAFDHTDEGKAQLNKSIGYIRKCLLEGKSSVEAISDYLKN